MASQKLLLIAGGIGITPIRAIFEEAAEKNIDTVLFYSARDKKDFIFIKEFENLNKNKNFKIIYFETSKKGQLNKNLLLQYIKDISSRDIYVCGPPSLIDRVVAIAKEMKIDKKQIHYEKFSLH